MFAKVYTQIFDSSIAENYTVRHVFMDLLVLADSEGVVDMTTHAISRRTNVPVEIVRDAMHTLSEPDPESRSPDEDGRRIALVDPHREWGWRIINYDHYRKLRDEEGRRAYHRDYMKKYRSKGGVKSGEGLLSPVKACEDPLRDVKSSEALLTHAEAEEEGDVRTPKPPKGGRKRSVTKVQVNNPRALRISALFGRRPDTPWLQDEWEKYLELQPSEEEVRDIEVYYATGDRFLRQDLKTLLNNWMGELDRAAKHLNQARKSQPYSPNL